jgi:class 3 adenylate cyclase/CHASE2 domain-containing sensor protein
VKARSKLSFTSNIPILIAAGVIGLVCLAQALPSFFPQFDVFQRLEWMAYDWRVRLAASQSQPVETRPFAGVFIDDNALKIMYDGSLGYRFSWPWPRSFYGRVVRELKAQGAQFVGFDILFDQLQPPNPDSEVHVGNQPPISSDDFFARQLREAGNVILAAESGNDLFPADVFRTNALDVGNISSRTDADAILRRVKAFTEYRVWHPVIQYVARGLSLDLSKARFDPGRISFPMRGGGRHEILLNQDGSLKLEEIIAGEPPSTPAMPYTTERIWHLGIILAARQSKLDLANAIVKPDRIILRGAPGIERVIPVDRDGYFYIDWTLRWNDPRFTSENIIKLIGMDEAREAGTNCVPRFKDKLVVVGSIGTGNNISDRGATPLEKETMLIAKHWNVANSIITGRFVRKTSYSGELFLILLMGIVSALLTWKWRALLSSLLVVLTLTAYCGLSLFFFTGYRYWLPLILPVGGALFMTHVCMITYRVRVEQKEKRRIRSVFSKIVSPDVVNELLKAESVSLGGARRRVTIYFADIRGFTRMTDEIQAEADEYIREHQLPPATAEDYLDQQASDLLSTVSLYLSLIADTVINHRGTLDKYIGDCVLAFWGAPIPNDRHALDCVRAAIDAQRAIYQLNLRRAAENKRREQEAEARLAAGQRPAPMLRLLALGSGINTGTVTVGLMGSDEHRLNYTVLGREVNLASRLEGVSGRGRIIISEPTYREIQRLDSKLAATCAELPPQEVKGFREAVKIYEVHWREMDTETRAYDTGILTGARGTPPTDFITPTGP